MRACLLIALLGLVGSIAGQPLDRSVRVDGALPVTDDVVTLRKRLEADLTGMAAAQLLLAGKEGFTQLIDASHTGGTVARRAAVWAAGVSDDPRAPKIVANGLVDRDYKVIDQARRAVWARPTRYLTAVERQLHVTPQAKKWSLLRALSDMGEDGARVLAMELRGAKGPLRKQLADVLLDSPKSRDALAAELIEDQDAEVRKAAYRRLMQSPNKARRQLLWMGLHDREVTVRRLVSETFRRFIAPSAVDKMSHASRDSDAEVRVNAAWGFGNLVYLDYAMEAAPKGLAGLYGMLDDKDPKVLATVSERIANFASLGSRRAIALKEQEYPGSQALRQLRNLLGRSDVKLRLFRIMSESASSQSRSAACALACLGDRRALPSLLAQLKSLDSSNVFSVASGFAVIGDKSTTEPLLTAIRTANSYVAGALLSAFEGIPDPNAVPTLLKILRDPQEDFQRRSAAGRALATIPDQSAHSAVISFVRDATVEPMLRGSVLYGLAWIQGPEAYAALVEALSEPSMASARWQAISVLGLRGDPRAIPLIEPFLTHPDESIRLSAKTAAERLRRIERVPSPQR